MHANLFCIIYTGGRDKTSKEQRETSQVKFNVSNEHHQLSPIGNRTRSGRNRSASPTGVAESSRAVPAAATAALPATAIRVCTMVKESKRGTRKPLPNGVDARRLQKEGNRYNKKLVGQRDDQGDAEDVQNAEDVKTASIRARL